MAQQRNSSVAGNGPMSKSEPKTGAVLLFGVSYLKPGIRIGVLLGEIDDPGR